MPSRVFATKSSPYGLDGIVCRVIAFRFYNLCIARTSEGACSWASSGSGIYRIRNSRCLSSFRRTHPVGLSIGPLHLWILAITPTASLAVTAFGTLPIVLVTLDVRQFAFS